MISVSGALIGFCSDAGSSVSGTTTVSGDAPDAWATVAHWTAGSSAVAGYEPATVAASTADDINLVIILILNNKQNAILLLLLHGLMGLYGLE
ncbi:MAG: hypothetical protein NHB36_09910 [Nitrospira sp.]|nr:hypothetical protein [Nitrospira sp.]